MRHLSRRSLAAIDANVDIAGDQAFTLIGQTSTFTDVAQLAYHYEVVSGTEYTVLEGNVNADLAADFQIALLGHYTFLPATPDLIP